MNFTGTTDIAGNNADSLFTNPHGYLVNKINDYRFEVSSIITVVSGPPTANIYMTNRNIRIPIRIRMHTENSRNHILMVE